MKHSMIVEKYDGSLAALAEDLGNLRYDALELFLRHLQAKLLKDSLADWHRDRRKLHTALGKAAEGLSNAAFYTGRAWDISKPFMKETNEP